MLSQHRFTTIVIVFYVLTVSLVTLVEKTDGGKNLQNTTRSQNNTSSNKFRIINAIGLGECAIGIIANGLLLIVIIRNPLNNLRRLSWITITNLAMADLLTSVATIPFCRKPSEVFDRNDKSQLDLKSANAFLYVGYSASFFMLLVFAIGRYIAVKYPLQAGRILTKKRVCLTCFICWIAALIIGSVNFYELRPSYTLKVFISIFCLLEIVVVFLVAITVFLIKQILMVSQDLETSNRTNAQRKDIVTTLVILIFVLLFTAFPYFIGKQIEFINHDNPQLSLGAIARNFPYYYFPIANLNFIVNPFVYAWKLSEYRRALVAFFTRKTSVAATRSPTKETKL